VGVGTFTGASARTRKPDPNRGTKISELRTWYTVKGTCHQRTVAKSIPAGRNRKYQSPTSVHTSYAIVRGTEIVVKTAIVFVRHRTRRRIRKPPITATNAYPEYTNAASPRIENAG